MFNSLLFIGYGVFFFSIGTLLLFTNFNVNSVFYFFTDVFNVDIFSSFLILTTIVTLFICTHIIDNKYFLKNKKYYILFFSFFFIIVGLVMSRNYVSFFIFYELLLIPSYLLVKESSPNRRSEFTANYFLLWTQFGSFLVLLGVFVYAIESKLPTFEAVNLSVPSLFIQLFIFFGFGVKIPLWPFHFWLSKTHVEANTGFSIFLSGILVKAAVFGLYKFAYIFNTNFSWFFISIVVFSLLDASLKMCVQVDLKKLVAFSTIQEMGFMVFLLLFTSTANYNILFAFTIFHTFISGLFFFIVDCIYRRYSSRVVYNISGINNICPTLSLLILVSVYIFIGLPFTIKFSIEVYVIKNLLQYNMFLAFVIAVFTNYISIIFFFKAFVIINFGSTPNLKGLDLTKKEFYLLSLFILPIIMMGFI